MITTIDKNTLKRVQRFGKHSSVKNTVAQQSRFDNSKENIDLLLNCQNDWESLNSLRADRMRCLRYKNGDQWGDVVKDPETGKMSREDVILSNSGKVPLKHNFIQQFVRNIHGQMLANKSQSVVNARAKDDTQLSEMLTNTLHAVQQLNETDTLDISTMEDLLLGGLACMKSRYCFWSTKNRADGRFDIVSVNRLFFNTDVEDPRLFDLRRIGEIHDYTMDDLLGNFASSKEDQEELIKLYGHVMYGLENLNNNDKTKIQSVGSFLQPDSFDKCRVIEVWQKRGRWVTYCHDYADGTEQITALSPNEVEKINKERIASGLALGMNESDIATIYYKRQYEYYWSVKYLTPNGVCIKSLETPYTHEEHPYTLAYMPMVDGVIKGAMIDLIDIQRYINRLIVMIDFIMGSSAKGVLMIPEDCIPDGMTVEDFTNEWVKTNGVIVYKVKPGQTDIPTTIATNSTNIGAFEMLNLQMSLIQQISGLSGAIQGQTARSNTPSSLYAQEAQNSSNNYRLVFDIFAGFLKRRDEKMLKILMQFYTDRRYVDISGRSYQDLAKYYDPQMASKIVDFNLIVSQSVDTPVFRQMYDDLMMDFLKNQFIDFETFLDNCSLPFAEKLKSDIKTKREQNQGAELTPQQMEQLMVQQGQTDPKAQAMLSQFAGR